MELDIVSKYTVGGMGMRVTIDRDRGITLSDGWFYPKRPKMKIDGGFHADEPGFTAEDVRQHLMEEDGFTEAEWQEWFKAMEAARPEEVA